MQKVEPAQPAATVVVDPDTYPPVRSRDPDDNYLIALASTHRAALVSGDKDLLALEAEIPCSHHAVSSSYLPRRYTQGMDKKQSCHLSQTATG